MSSSSTTRHSASHTRTSGTPTPTGRSRDDNESPTSRPLLFFVALGFGVVFTNLWIIVGVKYCFRYNQRARQGAVDGETGEPIDLPNMARPRRRREKKLMTMEEVNERFPLTKYKLWRATREQEGMPPEGGITATASRAASIKEIVQERISTDVDTGKPTDNSTQEPATSSAAQQGSSTDARDFVDNDSSKNPVVREQTVDEKVPLQQPDLSNAPVTAQPVKYGPSADDDEDDPIRTAVPAELLQTPGDACAICIDTIDDEDEVRGLTCGHAFHAGCLDPWLTSRRACCPLCKADYYIPKTRPEGETASTEAGATRDPQVSTPANVWMGGRGGVAFRPRIIIAGSRFAVDHHDRYGFPVLVRENRQRRNQQSESNDAQADGEAPRQSRTPGVGARFLNAVRNIPAGLRAPPLRSRTEREAERNAAQESSTEAQTTPGQLEAGTR